MRVSLGARSGGATLNGSGFTQNPESSPGLEGGSGSSPTLLIPPIPTLLCVAHPRSFPNTARLGCIHRSQLNTISQGYGKTFDISPGDSGSRQVLSAEMSS